MKEKTQSEKDVALWYITTGIVWWLRTSTLMQASDWWIKTATEVDKLCEWSCLTDVSHPS